MASIVSSSSVQSELRMVETAFDIENLIKDSLKAILSYVINKNPSNAREYEKYRAKAIKKHQKILGTGVEAPWAFMGLSSGLDISKLINIYINRQTMSTSQLGQYVSTSTEGKKQKIEFISNSISRMSGVLFQVDTTGTLNEININFQLIQRGRNAEQYSGADLDSFTRAEKTTSAEVRAIANANKAFGSDFADLIRQCRPYAIITGGNGIRFISDHLERLGYKLPITSKEGAIGVFNDPKVLTLLNILNNKNIENICHLIDSEFAVGLLMTAEKATFATEQQLCAMKENIKSYLVSEEDLVASNHSVASSSTSVRTPVSLRDANDVISKPITPEIIKPYWQSRGITPFADDKRRTMKVGGAQKNSVGKFVAIFDLNIGLTPNSVGVDLSTGDIRRGSKVAKRLSFESSSGSSDGEVTNGRYSPVPVELGAATEALRNKTVQQMIQEAELVAGIHRDSRILPVYSKSRAGSSVPVIQDIPAVPHSASSVVSDPVRMDSCDVVPARTSQGNINPESGVSYTPIGFSTARGVFQQKIEAERREAAAAAAAGKGGAILR